MTENDFNKLKRFGHWVGIIALILGFIFSIRFDQSLYVIGGFLGYWLVNYAVIRGFLVTQYLRNNGP